MDVSVYNTALSHQPDRIASFEASADLEELGNPSDEEQGPGSHHTSLFGIRDPTPQIPPVPPPMDIVPKPFKLALSPTPSDQKRARQGNSGPTLKRARSLPINPNMRKYTVFERAGGEDCEFERSR
jgi:hypothetical protein